MTDEKKSASAEATTDENKDHNSLEFWRKKAEEHLDGWKRAKADYLNLKKDSQKEKEELIKFSNAALVIEVLPIYDHLKLAFNHLPKELENNEWVKGIAGIKKQTQGFLESLGIKEIKTVGEKFDPNFHEAVAHEKKDGFKTDIIFEEVKPGYVTEGKVLYPAKVKVAK